MPPSQPLLGILYGLFFYTDHGGNNADDVVVQHPSLALSFSKGLKLKKISLNILTAAGSFFRSLLGHIIMMKIETLHFGHTSGRCVFVPAAAAEDEKTVELIKRNMYIQMKFVIFEVDGGLKF